LAATTRKTYATAQRSFTSFCESHGVVDALPASEDLVCLWLGFLAQTLKYTSIKTYLYGLQSLHTDMAVECCIPSSHIVERFYRGIKRIQGANAAGKPRFPVTTAVLRRITPLLDPKRSEHRLLRAALWVATTGLFRIGEITVNSSSQSSGALFLRALCAVQLYPPVLAIRLSKSKTDPFRHGVDVKLCNPTTDAFLSDYLCRRPLSTTPSSPLFAFDNGQALTRRTLLDAAASLLATAGIDRSEFSGLSFRRGGATSLSAAGVSDRLVQILGRWSGYSYKLYIDTPLQQLVDAASKF
jgi:hypothetical protein